MKEINKRIHRVVGQLQTVDAAIAAEQSCKDVIPQLLAVKGALDATVQTYLESAIDECDVSANTDEVKKIIKMFLKHVA